MEFKPMDKQEIRNWYGREFTETFPPNEQKPLAFILELVDAGRYTLLGLYDGETLLGYASLQTHPDYPGYVLLDYLGVTAATADWAAAFYPCWKNSFGERPVSSPRQRVPFPAELRRRMTCGAAASAFTGETVCGRSMRWAPAASGARR